MRILNFANRNFKEITRDPLSIVFNILLPLFLLFIFQQFKIPNNVYKIENFTPGIIIFGYSFITLFTSTLIAKDRSTSLLNRLGTSPMKTVDFILGYVLSVIPIILIQNVLFFITALLLGLSFTINIILVIIIGLLISSLFILLGILIGSITSEKSSSGVSSIIVQLVAFTSGMYFDSSMLSKTFDTICNILPFNSCLNILKNTLNGINYNYTGDILKVFIYIIITLFISIVIFKKNMISDNK